jgi:hypothetical protein
METTTRHDMSANYIYLYGKVHKVVVQTIFRLVHIKNYRYENFNYQILFRNSDCSFFKLFTGTFYNANDLQVIFSHLPITKRLFE